MDQLSSDAREARALGLSYGQYIGLRWEAYLKRKAEESRQQEEIRARKRAEREAALAKAEAEAAEKRRAEEAARAEAERKRAEKVKPLKKQSRSRPKLNCCRWCGKEFPFKGNNAFCSSKCRHAQQLFNQRVYAYKKAGKLPPSKEEFITAAEKKQAKQAQGGAKNEK